MSPLARTVASLAVVATVLAGLTACAPRPAELAADWLRDQPHVESVVTPSETFLDPESPITAIVEARTTDAELKQLALAASAQLATYERPPGLTLTLANLSLAVAADSAGVAAAADNLAAVRGDARVASGLFSTGVTSLVAAKAELLPVYIDHANSTQELTVSAGLGENAFSLTAGLGCVTAATAGITAILDDADIVSATLDACGESVVSATTAEVVPALIDRLQPAVAGSELYVTVVWQARPRSIVVALDSVTDAARPIILAALADDLIGVKATAEGLVLETEPDRLRDVLLAAAANPMIVDPVQTVVGGLTVRADGVSIRASTTEQARQFLELVDPVVALGLESVQLTATPYFVDVVLSYDSTEEDGKRVLDVLHAAGAGGDYDVRVADGSSYGFVLDRNGNASADSPAGERLLDYWNSLE